VAGSARPRGSSIDAPGAARDTTLLGGRYRLSKCLAIGGAAAVWEGLDVVLDRGVAVKILKPTLTGDPTVVRRFRREAVAIARLHHPNVVGVFDTVSDDGREAIVMELVRGRTLRELLDVQGRLPSHEVIEIAAQVAHGLEAAHGIGIVHRDVKPGNVLLAHDGRVLVADFGIAKAIGTGSDLTDERTMMGTAKYLSPEQVTGHALDGRTDLYALGLVMFESLTGTLPFLADTLEATALARVRKEPAAVRDVRPDVPGPLADVVDRLLQRNPARRLQSAREVIEQLSALQVHTSREASSERRSTATLTSDRRERASEPPIPRRMALAALAVIAVVAVALATWSAGGRDETAADGSSVPSSGDVSIAPTTRGSFPQRSIGVARAEVFDPPPAIADSWAGRVAHAADGDPTTAWQTPSFAARVPTGGGIGLRLDLVRGVEDPALTITSERSGWRAEIYASNAPPVDASGGVEAWGPAVATVDGRAGTTLVGPLPAGTVGAVLIWIVDLGPAPGDDAASGFTLAVNEVTVLGA
jgi:eukaryotic-like serine/threonine-protein kinase